MKEPLAIIAFVEDDEKGHMLAFCTRCDSEIIRWVQHLGRPRIEELIRRHAESCVQRHSVEVEGMLIHEDHCRASIVIHGECPKCHEKSPSIAITLGSDIERDRSMISALIIRARSQTVIWLLEHQGGPRETREETVQ